MDDRKKIEAIAIAAILAIAIFAGIMLAIAQPQVSVNDTPAAKVAPGETYIAYNITFVENATDSAFTNLSWFNISGWNTSFSFPADITDDIFNISLWNVTGAADYIAHNSSVTGFPINIPLNNYNVSNGTTAIINVNITLNTTGLIDGKNVSFNATLISWENSSAPDGGWVHTNDTNDTAPETIEVLDTAVGPSNTTAWEGDKNVLCANVTIIPGNNSVDSYLKAITFNATSGSTLDSTYIESFGLWNDSNANKTFEPASDKMIANVTDPTSVNVTFDLSNSILENRTITAGQNGTFFLTMNLSGTASGTYQATIFAQNITINQTADEGNTGNSSNTTKFTPLEIATPTPTPAPARRIVGGGRAAPSLGPGETTVSTEPTGEVKSTVTAPSADGKAVVTISAETIAKDAAGSPLTSVTVTQPSALPAGVPSGANYVGYAYTFGPEGATFSKPVTISITFDSAKYEGKTPVIHVYEAGTWNALATTVVGNRATATVTHFSTLVLFAAEVVEVTPSPTATPTPKPTPTATPTPTPTPEGPGFEAVFAIAGLLAVAYLVLRRKRK